MDKALELLLPRLSPETATLLQTQQRLSPEQVNEVIAEARSATNKGRKGNLFRLKDAYNTLFGFRGGVDLYDRVQRTYKDKGVEWTENRQGEIDFKFVDEREAEVVKLIRGQTAEQIWNNKTGFQKAVEKLLKKKNITLPTSSVLGSGKGLNSEAFTSIVRRVTGKSSLKELAQPGQRKALLGHLANLPTFTSPTETDKVRIFGSKLATSISETSSAYSTQSEIPAQFREALLYKVNELIYEKNPDTLPLAQYNNAKYMDMVMEAKKYGNTDRTEGYSIKGYDL